MTLDVVSIDIERASELALAMTDTADEIRSRTRQLSGQLNEAHQLLSGADLSSLATFESVATTLERHQSNLASRIRMVVFGGDDMLPGLDALDMLQASWGLIASRDGRQPDERLVSLDDLQWAANHLTGDAAAAAQWLLDHPAFLAAVETAKNNTSYIDLAALADETIAGGLAHGDGDNKLSLDDLAAFRTKLDTFTTLVPYLQTIDTASQGGKADGFLSRADFETFLNEYDLPPAAARAVQQVLDDGAFHQVDRLNFSTVLDALSYVPVIGDIVDGSRALYYAFNGDWAQAAIYGVGLLPIPGLSSSSLRVTRQGIEAVIDGTAARMARDGVQTIAEGGALEVVQRQVQKITADQLGRVGLDTAGNYFFERTFQSFDDLVGHFESGWLRYPGMAIAVSGARRATRSKDIPLPSRLDKVAGDDPIAQRILKAQVVAIVGPESPVTNETSRNQRTDRRQGADDETPVPTRPR